MGCPTFYCQIVVATFHLRDGFTNMLKYYVKASDLLERLRTDKDGVVSFEYVIVAACIVCAVVVLDIFGTGANTINGAAEITPGSPRSSPRSSLTNL